MANQLPLATFGAVVSARGSVLDVRFDVISGVDATSKGSAPKATDTRKEERHDVEMKTRREAYVGTRLDAQLDDQGRAFLGQSRKCRVDAAEH